MTTQKSEKKVDIWAKEKQPKRAKSKKPDGHLSKRKIIHYPGLVISLRLGVTQAMSACQWLSVVWTEILNICDLENCESTLKQDINWIY